MEDRAAVNDQLRSREREIAVTGGKLPDEPFLEDAQINRLDRRIRIGQERVRDWKAAESQAGIDALIAEMAKSWVAFGAAVAGQLLEKFWQAALIMRAGRGRPLFAFHLQHPAAMRAAFWHCGFHDLA